MKIVINALAAERGGSTTNYEGLLPALAKADPDSDYVLLRAPWQDYLPRAPGRNFRWVVCPIPRRSLASRAWFEQTRLVGVLRRERADVLYSPSEVTTFAAPCPVVLMLQNLSPYAMRWRLGFAYWRRNVLLGEMARLSAWKAERIIFVSETSRRIIAGKLLLPWKKTVVIHHGIDPSFSRPRKDRPRPPASFLNRPYFLSVSQIRVAKNYPRLVQAFASLCKLAGFDYDLVIIGKVDEAKAGRDLARIIEREGIRDRVHLPGAVPHEELPAWYAAATVFVFPSLLESFGHPLVEAMASGVPVVASSAPAIPEVVEDAALLFDPRSPLSIADAISRVLTDRRLAEELSARGRVRASRFSWERAATETARVLREAARSA